MIELKCKPVKCRKKHDCEWCDEPLNPGDVCQYRAFIYQGEFQHGWMHLECFEAMNKSDFGYDNEYVPGDQSRGKVYGEL